MRPSAIDERPVDERIGPVGVANERHRQVRAVVEVDREPVPAATADADEVAPLVVEPGLAGDRQRLPVERDRAARVHRGPGVVVRAAGRTEVDPAVEVVQRRWLGRLEVQVERRDRPGSRPRPLRRREGRARAGRCRRSRSSSTRAGRRSSDRSGSTPETRQVEAGRRSVGGPGRAIDLRADLEALAVVEVVAGLVGDGEVRGPGRREGAALGAEDDVLEAELRCAVVAAPRGGRCSTTTRSGGRAGRRRAGGRPGCGSAGADGGSVGGASDGRGAVGLARIGPAGGAAGGDGDDRQKGCQGGTSAAPHGCLIGRPRLRRRPRTWAVDRRRADPATPASTSSSARAGASWPARAGRGRPSRRGPRRSRRRGRGP